MFNFLKKLFPFFSKSLNDVEMIALRAAVDGQLKNVSVDARTSTVSIKVDPKMSLDLANIYLDKLSKEYGDKLGKKLVFTAVK